MHKRIKTLEGLRGISIILVLLSHYVSDTIPGGLGVNIFFVISGFIITRNAIRESQTTGTFSVRRFYLRRVAKIAPGLILLVWVPSIIAWIYGKITALALASQVFLIYNWTIALSKLAPGAELPGSHVLWSLSIEEQFYLVFAIGFFACTKWPNLRRFFTGAIITASAGTWILKLLLFAHGASIERLYFGTDTRAEAICWGILVALAQQFEIIGKHRFKPILRDALIFICATATLGSLFISDLAFQNVGKYSFECTMIAAVLYLLVDSEFTEIGIFHRLLEIKPLQFIGKISYSLYLCHWIIYFALSHICPPNLLVPLGVVASVISAWIVTRFVEQPIVFAVKRRQTD